MSNRVDLVYTGEDCIVIPSGDLNQGLRVSVFLNLTHGLNGSATTAGYPVNLFAEVCKQPIYLFFHSSTSSGPRNQTMYIFQNYWSTLESGNS